MGSIPQPAPRFPHLTNCRGLRAPAFPMEAPLDEIDKPPDYDVEIWCPDCVDGLVEPVANEDFWQCQKCKHTFADQLIERQVERAKRPGGMSFWAIKRLLQEDAERKKRAGKGGGRSSKSYGKDDKLGSVILRPTFDESFFSSSSQQLERKSLMLTVRGMPNLGSDRLRTLVFDFLVKTPHRCLPPATDLAWDADDGPAKLRVSPGEMGYLKNAARQRETNVSDMIRKIVWLRVEVD